MGSSGGENRGSRACYATLRDYLGTGANSGDEVACRRVAHSVNGPVDFIGTQSCDLVASRRVACKRGFTGRNIQYPFHK